MTPKKRVRVVNKGTSDPVVIVNHGPRVPVVVVSDGPSDPVRTNVNLQIGQQYNVKFGKYSSDEPSITSFIPWSVAGIDIPISSFIANADYYLITETATIPTISDPGWTATVPTNFTASGYGNVTLYAWVQKNGAISHSVSFNVFVVGSDITSAEANALIYFYDNTDGDNWVDNTNWMTDITCNNWSGVFLIGGNHVGYLYKHSDANIIGDITNFPFGDLQWLVDLRIFGTSLTGNVTNWDVANLHNIRIYSTSLSGNWSGWVLSNSLVDIYASNISATGSISSWIIPATTTTIDFTNTLISGAPDITGAVALNYYSLRGCDLSQADIDANLSNIYNRRAAFTHAAPVFRIDGINASPSGIYQDATPPTTGKEFIFKLVNDPDAEGFNKWTINYNP